MNGQCSNPCTLCPLSERKEVTELIQDTRVVVIAVKTARPMGHKQTPTTLLHICGFHINSLEGIIQCIYMHSSNLVTGNLRIHRADEYSDFSSTLG